MSTSQSAAEEVTELLAINRDDPKWCAGYLNRTVEVGVVTHQQSVSIWERVFGATPAAASAPVEPPSVSADFAGTPRGGAVGWLVLALIAATVLGTLGYLFWQYLQVVGL